MTFALLACALFAGGAARALRLTPPGASELINGYIIYVALPAMILQRVPALELNTTALVPIAMAWLAIIAAAALVLLAARHFQWSAEVTGALLLTAPLSNSAYLGLPLIGALFDTEALPYAILYDQLGNFMALAIYGSIVIAVCDLRGRSPTASGVVRRIVSFPPFLCTLLALTLSADALPAWAAAPLSALSLSMGPCAMFIVGLHFELSVPSSVRRPLAVGALIKLVAAPALLLLVARGLDIAGPQSQATIMQAAMPPMITAGLLGMAAGFSRPLIVAMIGGGTVISALSLPVVYGLVR